MTLGSNDGTGWPLASGYQYEARFSDEDMNTTMQNGEVIYGMPPYKLYELPRSGPSETTRYIWYYDQQYVPANWEITIWGRHEPRFVKRAEFNEPRKHPSSSRAFYAYSDWGEGHSYNAVIEYQEKYFVLILDTAATKKDSFLKIEFTDANMSCYWSPINR